MYYSSFGENPTKLYYDAVQELLKNGEECSPRGKLIKELRPVMIGFQNPYNRVTFLGSRRVNPFFQLAESLWIVSGRADVRWLTKFNANMSTFPTMGCGLMPLMESVSGRGIRMLFMALSSILLTR